jgi:hypothetical protein
VPGIGQGPNPFSGCRAYCQFTLKCGPHSYFRFVASFLRRAGGAEQPPEVLVASALDCHPKQHRRLRNKLRNDLRVKRPESTKSVAELHLLGAPLSSTEPQ